MFKLLKELMALQASIGIGLSDLLQFVRNLVAIGTPPAITDEGLMRDWLRRLCQVLRAFVDITPTGIDDKGVEVLSGMVENDSIWGVGYSLLKMMLARDDEDDLKVACGPDRDCEPTEDERKLAEQVCAAMAGDGNKVGMIDPMTIIAIVSMVVNLIRTFRNRS